MKKFIKKSLALLLTMIICASMIPASVFAAEAKGDVIETGDFGLDVEYTVYSSGLLEFTGKGPMTDAHTGAGFSDRTPYQDQANIITKIVIGKGITHIGDAAFWLLRNVESVQIPDTVKTIGAYAFRDCSSLKSVVIPQGVTELRDHTFDSCYELVSITVPDTVTAIGESAVAFCTELVKFDIPAAVTEIDDAAFEGCSSITNFVLPEGIKEVGEKAFSGCSNLTSIEIPKNITEISDSMFRGCTSLQTIKLHKGIVSVGDYAFECCDSLMAFVVPASGKAPDEEHEIGENAFYDCESMKELVLPESVTEIGNEAFTNCASLENITIPAGVTEIGDNAFNFCISLKNITLPEGVTEVGYSAFQDCKSLTKATLPNSLTYITAGMFCGCESLATVNIPGTVTEIGGESFANCTSLTSINIPQSVNVIGIGTFKGCTSLKAIDLPENIVKIYDDTFMNCTSLESIEVPAAVTYIGRQAFAGCTALKTVTLNEGLLEIYTYAFRKCSKLTNINIPGTVGKIGYEAFSACTKLSNLVFEGSAPVIDSYAFMNAVASAYYRCDHNSWTELTLLNYGGDITWNQYHAENEKLKTVAPTCTKDGYTNYKCLLCGKTYKDDIVKAKGHNYVKGKCTVCGDETTYVAPVKVSGSNVVSTGKIKLSWNKVAGAKEYKVYRATAKNGKYSLMKTVKETSYINNTSVGGKGYYYYVIAVAADGTKSEKSNIYFRTADYARPEVTATNVANTGKIKLSWKKVEGATSYRVYRADSKNGSYTLMKTVKNGATTYINTSAKAGKMYYYKVKAYGPNSNATSAYSVVDSRTCDLAKPVVKITTASGKPKLSWNKVEGAKEYKIYRSTSSFINFKAVQTTKNLNWKDTTAKKGTRYYYKVVAVHNNSNANSADSAVKSIKCTK